MAWTKMVCQKCGAEDRIQLYGPGRDREWKAQNHTCKACWIAGKREEEKALGAEVHAGPDGQGNIRIAVERAYEIKDALSAAGYRWDAAAREWYVLLAAPAPSAALRTEFAAKVAPAIAAGAKPDARVAAALAA